MTSKVFVGLSCRFRENNIDLPFGYTIGNPEWDNNFIRNHQVPNTQEPSSNQNTVDDFNYLIDFQRGHFFDNIDNIAPVRYRNGMMEPSNKESRNDNVIEMRWVLQREFASSVVFFHKVTIPPGAIEGTHRHIGTEELYCIVEGEGIAYMGDDDDPALSRYPCSNARDLRPWPPQLPRAAGETGQRDLHEERRHSRYPQPERRQATALRRVPLSHGLTDPADGYRT